MAKMRIQFAPSALEDLQAIAAWYADQDIPDIGQKMLASLMDAVKDLADYPEMGREVPEFNVPTLRELIRPPFRIVYRLEKQKPQAISVIRFWRSERILDLPPEKG